MPKLCGSVSPSSARRLRCSTSAVSLRTRHCALAVVAAEEMTIATTMDEIFMVSTYMVDWYMDAL